MKVLLIENFWQHTEVLGTWIDYFVEKGHDVTVYYPHFMKTPHNYLEIWGCIYNITLNFDGLINMHEFDLYVINTQEYNFVKLISQYNKPIISVSHYAIMDKTTNLSTEITVNPFRKSKFIMPLCPKLATILNDSRQKITPTKTITIVGNSFLGMPPDLFKQLINILTAAGWKITCVLYDYNKLDDYKCENLTVKTNCLALDLFAEIENSRYILFYPDKHHLCDRLSGSIVLSLIFGRPLLTLPDVLAFYNIECHYNLNDPTFILKLHDDVYYKTAQEHLEVRLNEFINEGRQTLDSVVEKIFNDLQTSTNTATTTICD